MRDWVRFAAVLGVLSFVSLGGCFAAWAQTTRTPAPRDYGEGGALPMPPERAADSYAIYSLLMPGQPFAQFPADQTQHWAIAAVTVNTTDRDPAVPPDGQLKPPPDHPRRFREAVEDYETNQYVRVHLTEDQFQISHDFSLLSPEQVADFRTVRTGPQVTSTARARWAGYPGITFFSEVYFDTHHDGALVYMNDWCAHLCASGTWIYLEKHGGQWVRRSGIVTPGD